MQPLTPKWPSWQQQQPHLRGIYFTCFVVAGLVAAPTGGAAQQLQPGSLDRSTVPGWPWALFSTVTCGVRKCPAVGLEVEQPQQVHAQNSSVLLRLSGT